jgi:hypothetical protein
MFIRGYDFPYLLQTGDYVHHADQINPIELNLNNIAYRKRYGCIPTF